MAESTKGLLEHGPGDALVDGAARFDQLIQSVRSQQAAQVEIPDRPALNPLLKLSPGEEWARNFQAQSIGPETGATASPEFAPVARSWVLPAEPSNIVLPTRMTSPVPEKFALQEPELRFGKVEKPRKSWFGRLLSRS